MVELAPWEGYNEDTEGGTLAQSLTRIDSDRPGETLDVGAVDSCWVLGGEVALFFTRPLELLLLLFSLLWLFRFQFMSLVCRFQFPVVFMTVSSPEGEGQKQEAAEFAKMASDDEITATFEFA